MRRLALFCCLILLTSGSSAQTVQGSIYLFRRHYAPGNKPSVFLDGVRIARMQSDTYFSVSVDPGTHRLQSSLSADAELTDVEILAGKTVYVEMTFAEVPHQGSTLSHGQWLKTALFESTPGTVARDRFPKLKPLDPKWAFDERVKLSTPDFP